MPRPVATRVADQAAFATLAALAALRTVAPIVLLASAAHAEPDATATRAAPTALSSPVTSASQTRFGNDIDHVFNVAPAARLASENDRSSHAARLPSATITPASQASAKPREPSLPITAMAVLVTLIAALLAIYAMRHCLFTVNRLFGRQRHPYIDVEHHDWPMITVLIAAHNEEKVIGRCIRALLDTTYPKHRLKIVPVNDRSTDRTQDVIDELRALHGDRIAPYHRTDGKPGKSAALKDALRHVEGDIAIIFDADYVPGTGLLKQLVAPFFDPEVGAVMGRVVPVNTATNLLTRMLDLERAAGYQVDQQARMNLRLVPQYGGTVGGVRCSAVAAVGGWYDDMLAEDTDITFRLLLDGWKTVYTNRAECYEEVPEDWATRRRQILRWSMGHNQVLLRDWHRLLRSPFLTLAERIDGALLLFVYFMPVVLLLGWTLLIGLYYLAAEPLTSLLIAPFALMAYSTIGNFAAFFEMAIAVAIDGHRGRIRLLPINLLCFLVSLFTSARGPFALLADALFKRDIVWNKTPRYRRAEEIA